MRWYHAPASSLLCPASSSLGSWHQSPHLGSALEKPTARQAGRRKVRDNLTPLNSGLETLRWSRSAEPSTAVSTQTETRLRQVGEAPKPNVNGRKASCQRKHPWEILCKMFINIQNDRKSCLQTQAHIVLKAQKALEIIENATEGGEVGLKHRGTTIVFYSFMKN